MRADLHDAMSEREARLHDEKLALAAKVGYLRTKLDEARHLLQVGVDQTTMSLPAQTEPHGPLDSARRMWRDDAKKLLAELHDDFAAWEVLRDV